MANEYVVNLLDNATEQAVGEIKYAISPDYSRGVTRGEEIRISGTARWTQYAIRSIGYRVWWKEANGGTTYQDFEVNASIAIGATGKFELAFQIPDAAFDAMPTRVHKAEEDHGTYPIGDVDAYISVSSAPVQQWADLAQARDERLVLLKYRLAPQILALDFERATPEGKWADDGQYLQCKALRLAVDPRAAAGDITKATIVCTGSDGSTRSANLTKEQLAAALTSEGYSETKPGIFADFASALGVDYTLTLTVGDAYDQTSRTDGVMRSFARLHLSGAKRGGVAVGMFSTSTDDHPKFEVDESHESHFYGGIVGVPEYLGKVDGWVDGGKGSGTTGNPYTVYATITPPEGANFFHVQQNAGYNSIMVAAGVGPLIDGIRTVTLVGQRIADGNHSSDIPFSVHCFKIPGYVEPVAADPGLPEGPSIFDEPYADPGVARADYIAMMSGIEIPDDVETAVDSGAQADPNGMESPGIDGEPEPGPSAHYDTVALYYRTETWSAAMVRNAVGRWITADEAAQILTTQKESE